MLLEPAVVTENLQLTTDDGVLLAARWHPHPGARGTVVVVPGFSAHSDEPQVSALASELVGDGFQVLTYDARGHGASGGACSVGSEEHRDVSAATAWATGRGAPVVLVGVSMGAIAVVRHLAQAATTADPPAGAPPARFTQSGGGPGGAGDASGGAGRNAAGIVGAVLVSAPSRWRMRPSPIGLLMAVVTRTRPGRWAAGRWLGVRVAPRCRAGEAPEATVRNVRVPVAVVHGQRDRLLGIEHARRLHLAAATDGRSSLALVDGMGHGLDAPARQVVRCSVTDLLAQAHPDPAVAPPGDA